MSNKVKFKIFRHNPEEEPLGRFAEYDLMVEPGDTILNCINKIKWEQDQTIAHRYSCGSAICGSCTMRINGKATLVCKTQVNDRVVDGQIEIAPIGNASLIRDLVVDLDPFFDKLEKIVPYLKPSSSDEPELERLQTNSDFLKIDKPTTCILCAACFSDCNVLEVDPKFLGPATLAKAHRFIFDSRDSQTYSRLRVITDDAGVWDCVHCAECSTRCPTETKPLARIEEIKTEAMAKGTTNSNGARHALAFRETVGKRGLLDENYVPVRSVGFFNIVEIIGLMPVGLRMLMRGKNPPIIPHSIDRSEEIRNIFANFEELRK
ncbi:MAG: succinate dehydrogenase iron-sulfur subunit [Nitrospinota bacterium]